MDGLIKATEKPLRADKKAGTESIGRGVGGPGLSISLLLEEGRQGEQS